MDKILEILDLLLTLKLLAEQVHLCSNSSNSYSDHRLAEQVQEDLDEDIDALKEIAIYCYDKDQINDITSASRATAKVNSYLKNIQPSESLTQYFSYLFEIIQRIITYCDSFEGPSPLNTIIGDIARDIARKGYLVKQRLTGVSK